MLAGACCIIIIIIIIIIRNIWIFPLILKNIKQNY